jgi:hypothetical protein
MNNIIVQKRKKLCTNIAKAAPKAATAATMAAIIKPYFRPILPISRAAGIVKNATPTTTNAIGRVANAGDGASSEPTIAPARRTNGIPELPSAWQALNMPTFRPKRVSAYIGTSIRVLVCFFTIILYFDIP